MKYLLREVESVRADGPLLRALRALRDALNDLAGRREAGFAQLEAGVARVTVPGLQAGTVVTPGWVKEGGTPGNRLLCNREEYDLEARTAVIRSSSATDTSTVSWVATT